MGFKLTSAVGEGCFLQVRKEQFVKNYKWEKKKIFLENYQATGPWALPSLNYASYIFPILSP